MFKEVKKRLVRRSAKDVIVTEQSNFQGFIALWLCVIECSLIRYFEKSNEDKKYTISYEKSNWLKKLFRIKPKETKKEWFTRDWLLENLDIKELEDLYWEVLEIEGVDVVKAKSDQKELKESLLEKQDNTTEEVKKKP